MKHYKPLSVLWPIAIACVPAALAGTIHVPAEQATIQAAINAAVNGDEILVGPGTYPGAVNFNGKSIQLRSTGGPAVTTIDGTGLLVSTVACMSGEGPGTTLEGFSVLRPQWETDYRVEIDHSSLAIINCRFLGNLAAEGGILCYSGNLTVTNCQFDSINGREGAVLFFNGSATFADCSFTHNSGSNVPAAITCHGTALLVTGCVFDSNSCRGIDLQSYPESQGRIVNSIFRNNSAGGIHASSSPVEIDGCLVVGNGGLGGVYVEDTNLRLTNSTIVGNSNGWAGGVFHRNWRQAPILSNNIIRGNSISQILLVDWWPTAVSSCNVEGNYTGVSNIDVDPQFVDAAGGNYELAPGSPCIDAGSNLLNRAGTAIDGTCRIKDGNNDGVPFIDIGAYEAAGALLDCNGNGQCDPVEGAAGGITDCNHNLIEDACDISTGASLDRNLNTIPDECDPDCNGNLQPDDYDITSGASLDCNGNGQPDECDIAAGLSVDCNLNGTPDDCDIASGASLDDYPPGGDGIPDECQSVYNVTRSTRYSTIRTALNDAFDGDEIAVGPRRYPESIHMYKSVYLHSIAGAHETIIDAMGRETAVSIDGNWDPNFPIQIMEGFTITGARSEWNSGNGLTFSSFAAPATVRSCVITGNTSCGGAVYAGGNAKLENCLIYGNDNAGCTGFGLPSQLYSRGFSGTLTNCTIVGEGGDPAILFEYFTGTMSNCIVRNQSMPPFYDWGFYGTVEFSNLEGGWPGPGNVDADPQFTNRAAGDFRLLEGSPCIDAGNDAAIPASLVTDLSGGSRLVGAHVDMGAFEAPCPAVDSDSDGTPDCDDGCPNDPNKTEAGVCGCGTADSDSDGDGLADCVDTCPNDPTVHCGQCPGDTNGDHITDLADLTTLLGNFGSAGASWAQGDFTYDGNVDLGDLTTLLSHFGETCP